MASPLTLRVDVDMAQLIKAARDAGVQVDDLSDAFDDVDRSSDQATKEAIQGLDDVDRAADSAGDGVKSGLGDAFQDVGGIAQDAMSGDVAGALEGVAGAVSNLGGSIPVIGTALTLAAGVGAAAFAAIQADSEATQQRVSDMYDDMVSSSSAALSQTFLLAEAQALIGDEARLAQAQKYADLLGLDLPTVIGALIGDTDDLATAQDRVGEAVDATKGKVEGFSVTQSETTTKNQELFAALQEARAEFDKSAGAVDSAGQKYKAYSDYAADLEGSAGDATNSVELLNSTLAKVPSETEALLRVKIDDSAVRAWKPPAWATTVTPKMGAPAP